MHSVGELWRRLLAIVFRRRLDRDLAEEMRFHLEMKARQHQDSGMGAEEARQAAARRFGNMALLQEDSREAWGWSAADRLLQDTKYALRMLAKNRGLTAVAAITLALGIGANTVIFSVVHAVLLAPLPYGEPARLARVWSSHGDSRQILMSAADAADLREQATTFQDVAAAGFTSADFAGRGEPERVGGSRVTANLFAVLGVQPILGRGLEAADDRPGAPAVVVLSHGLWQRRFGGDPGTIGKAVAIGRASRLIVGVMPAGFYFPMEKTEFWIPLGADPVRAMRNARMFSVVGRLKPGAAWKTATAEAKTVAARLESAYPDKNRGWGFEVMPLTESVVSGVRQALLILSGAVAMVLLVACANVANLLLSRGVQRQQEMAVRAALGAGRRRLLRLLFLESLALAVLGGALGVAIAACGSHALAPIYPSNLPRSGAIRLNAEVLGFTIVVSLVTAVLAGLLPALRISRADLGSVLKAGMASRGFRTGRARAALVAGQVAMAMVLLACAGLLLRSFLLRTRASGFDPSNVLTVSLDVPPARLAAVLERIGTIPGVVAAGAGSSLPYAPGMRTDVGDGGNASIFFDVVTPDYLRALHIPIRRGRPIDARDTASAPPVLVINEAMARRYFPGEDPIGKQLRVHETMRTVVGVVGNLALGNELPPAMYLAYLQDQSRADHIALRTSAAPQDLAGAVRAAVRELEPKAVISMATVEEDLSRLSASPRFYLLLMALFAGLALSLSALGVYGVVSFAVTLRTREIGVRIALGASGSDVRRAVFGQALRLAISGVAIGGIAALWATRLLKGSSLLFGIEPNDPLTFAAAPAVLILSAVAACWLPARRATKVDPAVSLRYE